MPTVTPGLTPTDNLTRIDTAIRNNPGGEVILEGTFPFGAAGSITINNPITIKAGSGGATIQDGTIPFQVKAPGQAVTIQGIHFVTPTKFAIEITAVNSLLITLCKIVGPVTLVPQTIVQSPIGPDVTFPFGGGISVVGPTSTGDLTIKNNDIDVGGGPSDRTNGVIFLRAGNSTVKANIRLSGNEIRNLTAHGIDLREIIGTAVIENNTVEPGPYHGQPTDLLDSFFNGIRCLGVGGYRVEGNVIKCVSESCAGIRLQGNFPTSPITGAVVTRNEISMSLPKPMTQSNQNAAVDIRRNCGSNSVSNNNITGESRTAVSLIAEPSPLDQTQTVLIPNRNGLTDNRLDGFDPTLADIFVGEQVDSTLISNFFDFPTQRIKESDRPLPPPLQPGRTVTIIDDGANTKMLGYFRIIRKGSGGVIK